MDRTVKIETREEFREELKKLINKYGMEKACDTPDYILADLLMGAYDNYSMHVTRRDNWFGFDPFNQNVGDETEEKPAEAKQTETEEPADTAEEQEEADSDDEEDVKSKAGFIVYRRDRKNRYTFFVEWRNGVPVFAEDENLAMRFTYKGMAENVASRLGEEWNIFDVDEVTDEKKCRACERLFKAIFGEDFDPEAEATIPKRSKMRVRGIIVEERKDNHE